MTFTWMALPVDVEKRSGTIGAELRAFDGSRMAGLPHPVPLPGGEGRGEGFLSFDKLTTLSGVEGETL
jgi:hypothetical protein